CTLSNHLDQPTLESDFSQLRPPFQAIPPETAAKQAGSDSFSEKFVEARSPSFLNQIDRVRHQELGRSVKRPSRGRNVRRIHHRATHNLSASSQLVWIS
ncbi:hypothetical protein Prudu_965S000200, partial [Prunus dulcis]